MNSEPKTNMEREGEEPKAARQAVPVWFFLVVFLLIYWGMLTFDLASGWFNREIYTPYRSAEELAQYQPAAGEDECFSEGKRVYSVYCAVCHMDSGVGNPGNGCPPLVGSEWLASPGAGRQVRIISKGLVGPIEVKGQQYGTGTMLPIGDQMPGDEKQKAEAIAAILCYVRKAFGSNSVPVTVEQVQAIREKIKDRTTSFTADEVKQVSETE